MTSTAEVPTFGGVAGADAICQARASAAGLRGTFRSWISDSTSSASSRLVHHNGPYYRVDGTMVRIVANDWTDLTDTIAVALATDEYGVTQGNQMVWSATRVGIRRTSAMGAVLILTLAHGASSPAWA